MDSGRTISARRTTGLLLVALAWALFLTLTGSPEAILFTVPVFLLAAPLAFGRYVGEEALAALRGRPRRRAATVPAFGLPQVVDLLVDRLESGRRPGRGPPLAAH